MDPVLLDGEFWRTVAAVVSAIVAVLIIPLLMWVTRRMDTIATELRGNMTDFQTTLSDKIDALQQQVSNNRVKVAEDRHADEGMK